MILRTLSDPQRATRLDRRRVLRTGGGGALAGAAALLAVPAVARAAHSTETMELDMACDGRTFQLNRLDSSDPTALPVPGDTFIVFGSIYPAGTIEQGLAGPDQDGAIGRWVCRGTFLVNIASGGVPHVVTTVVHILGDGISATSGQLEQGGDAIVTEGIEGGVPAVSTAIAGGYGTYAGMRGEMVQTLRGENDTLISLTPEVAVPAPNYTFTFKPTSS